MSYFEGIKTMKMMEAALKKGLILLCLFFLAACASNMASKKDAADTSMADEQGKLITGIRTTDAPDVFTVSITGNRMLTYTSVKQPLPLGLVLYFPETSLGLSKTEYAVEKGIVGMIKATELVENGPSKITITLKSDTPYDITRDQNTLNIHFSKAGQAGMTAEVAAAEPEQLPPAEEETEATAEEETTGMLPEAEAPEAEMPVAEEPIAPVEESTAAMATAAEPAAETAAAPEVETEAQESGAPSEPGVNMLRSVTAQMTDGGVLISIITDAPISDYNAFTLTNPARIVLDLKDVKSPMPKEQKVPVNTDQVSQVRHFGYPDKVRIVIDTQENYLSAYQTDAVDNMFQVRVGDVLEPAAESMAAAPAEEAAASETTEAPPMPEPEAAAAPAPEPEMPAAEESQPPAPTPQPEVATVPDTGKAMVNRIDFLSKDQGESTIIIGTTKPIQYELNKLDDKKLELLLSNTDILSYRQRPLITTRFESAVDRISPVQTPEMRSTAKIIIEMREAVPYTIVQDENQIKMDFAASQVPPQPLETADLPPWKKILEEAATAEPSEAATAKVAEAAPLEPADIPMPAPTEEIEPPADIAEPDMTETEADYGLEESAEMTGEAMTAEGIPFLKPRKPTRKYTGEKIALDFFQTDIKNVLRILRDVSGKNFAIDKDVKGQVTLTLVKPVPWDQVLDLILKMNQLGQISEGNIVRIVTLSTLKDEEKRRAEALKAEATLKEQQKALEPLITEYIPISYADASKDIKPRLTEISTPERGKIGVDQRNNQIIMTDTAEKIAQAKAIVRRVDKVTPQVIIEARIVEVSENYSQDLGVEWGISGQRTTTSAPGAASTNAWAVATNNLLPSSDAANIGYTFNRIVGTPFSLSAQLQAIEASGEGKIISAPKIVTLDNKEAMIKQGLEYPYLERDSSGLATVSFKNVDLELKVTPHVTPDNRISMKMNITKNDVDDFVSGVPSLATNEANTELLVNDGDTIVIGGIIKTITNKSQTRWPWLGKIPVVGWLFKQQAISDRKNELLIFITPRIVHLEQTM